MTTATIDTVTRPAPLAAPIAPAGAVVESSDANDDLSPAPGYAGYLLLPLAEFGQSLDNPGLDWWLEGFAGRNRDQAEYEITAQGELKIMPPTGFPWEWQEAQMTTAVVAWSNDYGGIAGGPTARFILPDGARQGPDAYWISAERWHSAPPAARQPPFAAIVPDFVAEIVSPSNRGPELLDKVRRYLEGGASLVWVINARQRRVTIYRPGMEPEILDDPELLHGGDVMPGFAFNVRQRIFDYNP